jgi:hypothetical protein
VDAVGPDDDQERMLAFMLEQADQLQRRHADADGSREGRQAYRQFRRRWGKQGEDAAEGTRVADPGRRALVIDERVPTGGRDGGSQAVLSHIVSLRRLGYAVSFVAAEEMVNRGPDVAALATAGVTVCGAPFYTSVEDVLRRQANCFDVAYLHRAGIATRYLALTRRYMARARILYSVADLHHVRLQREAAAEERPELLAASGSMRLEECVASWSADAVITHSTVEAALLRNAVPDANVHVVP